MNYYLGENLKMFSIIWFINALILCANLDPLTGGIYCCHWADYHQQTFRCLQHLVQLVSKSFKMRVSNLKGYRLGLLGVWMQGTLIELKPHTLIEIKPLTLIELKPLTLIELKTLTLIELKPDTLIELKPLTLIELKPLTLIELSLTHL